MAPRVILNRRHEQVLKATVQHYIATAEPVGSKAIAQGYDFSVSPATIRNAMGWLEKAGLLYQPHVSAGRVPSDSGYRIYVDQLISAPPPQVQDLGQTLSQRIGLGNWSTEALLRRTAQILSTLSGYIALVTLPQQTGARLKHFQLVPMEGGRAMLVVVTDNYQTHSTVFDIPGWDPETITPALEAQIRQDLERVSNCLNRQLQSQPFSQLHNLDWQALDRSVERYREAICSFLIALADSYKVPQLTQILMSGISEILHQPEFNELAQLQTIIHLLEEEQELLWPLIFETDEAAEQRSNSGAHLRSSSRAGSSSGPRAHQRVSVYIGTENPLEPMQACTLVSALYHCGDEPVGSVGLLGPTRMDYSVAIASVEATAAYLSEALR
ncbi:MAG: heat-inducible transcriptional repressor HrcA [Synechococcales cyanobacterium RM1_1_8]|nr:heat-inducible transcriptional repressor HrcA [Synechococcales cyanobacterium RM1_1_8]